MPKTTKTPGAGGSKVWDRQAVMKAVCERIAGGESVRAICADANMPDRRQINRWIGEDETLRKQYWDACRARTYFHAEEVIEIADTEPDPAVARVRIDARRWYCAKFNRVDFGDKVTQEHTGPGGGPVQVQHLTDEQLAAIAAGSGS